MYKKLVIYIEKHKVLYDKQYGFWKNHSTEMAIVNLTIKLTDAMDKNKLTVGIFLDLSKAFDTVDHSIIIAKLNHYGIRGIALECIAHDLLLQKLQGLGIAGDMVTDRTTYITGLKRLLYMDTDHAPEPSNSVCLKGQCSDRLYSLSSAMNYLTLHKTQLRTFICTQMTQPFTSLAPPQTQQLPS